MLTGAEYILKKLSLMDVKYIFGVPGAHIDPLFAASTNSGVEIIVNCHELSAGYMADGYSRASGKIGVIIAIGGPGSNNIVTAVNTARIEKIPLLIITGDVPTNFSDVPGFQCANGYGSNDDAIFKIITKYSKRVEKIEDLACSLEKAIKLALSPPFGPAHLIIPYNVLKEKTSAIPKQANYDKLKYWKNDNSKKTLLRVKDLILSNKKLIFWIGDSLNNKKHAEHIMRLADKFHIPVATSFAAKGVIPENHELAIGNFGYAGTSLSKGIFLSDKPDVIISFDIIQNERNSLNWNPDLYRGKELILINFPGSYKNELYGESIEDNPFYILKALWAFLKNVKYDVSFRKNWYKNVLEQLIFQKDNIPAIKDGVIEPALLIQIIQKEMPAGSLIFVDSGNHRVFPGFYWKALAAESFFSAPIMAPLGWALAAGIGCKFDRKEPVVVFTGDGCMQMHGIELKTAIKYNKSLLVVITNNNAFGCIYNRLSKVSNNADQMTCINEIDWNIFAKSFKAEVFSITSEKNLVRQIHKFIVNPRLTILNVRTPITPYIYDLSLANSAFA